MTPTSSRIASTLFLVLSVPALLIAGREDELPDAGAREPSFYRAVNLNGPPVAIDGHDWEGDDAPRFTCDDAPLRAPDLTLKPETDPQRAQMLRSFRWSRQARITVHDVPEGAYSVYAYVIEDNNPQRFDVFVEGMPAARGLRSGPGGTWQKAGPWAVEVTGGTLEITSRGGDANFCGIEVWSGIVRGAKRLEPLEEPASPYRGRFADRKPRVVIMTDIGGDPDDRQSLVRFLLYACDFDVEALVTGFGWGHRENLRPDLIREAVERYAEVHENLRRHRADYPAPEALLDLIRDGHEGDPHTVGPGMDSEGSRSIIRSLQRDDPRPVWFSIWGGPRELAQALWRMDRDMEPERFSELKKKIRVHSIADQDETAGWVKEHHPDVFWIYSDQTFRGFYAGGDEDLVSREWLDTHLLNDHGPLAQVYPRDAAGKKGVKEGDTPSFLYVLRNGLSDPEAPQWGSWGGRFAYSGAGWEYVDAHSGRHRGKATVHRWRPAYQNAFAARMDWCVKPPAEANHDPIAVLNRHGGTSVLRREILPEQRVTLSAAGSRDPDGDGLRYRWWFYTEPSSYAGEPAIENDRSAEATLRVPADATGRDLHIVLEVTDDGEPPLTAYRRLILDVAR